MQHYKMSQADSWCHFRLSHSSHDELQYRSVSAFPDLTHSNGSIRSPLWKDCGLSEIPALVLTEVPGWCGPAGGIASVSPQSFGAAAGGRVEPACSGEAAPTGSGSEAGAEAAWDESLLLNAPSSQEETEGEPRHCLGADKERRRKREWEWVYSSPKQ